MESPKIPDIVPALKSAPTQFEIVLADDPGGPLAFVSPPISDINEMAAIEKSAFSLKASLSESSVFVDAARERLQDLRKQALRFGESPTLLNRLANVHSVLGDRSLEEAALLRAYAAATNPFLARKLGEAQARLGKIESARQHFIRFSGEDSYAALRMASFAVVAGDLADANRWIATAIQINPAGYSERLFQGALCLVQGRYEQAVSYLRIAIEDRPVSSVAHANLGFAYLGLNRADKAFLSFKKAVAFDPFNRSALLALSDIAGALDKDLDAVNSLRYFVEFEQKEADVWARLARAHFRLGMIDDCLHALRSQGAIRATAEVWNNIGVAYAKKRDLDSSFKAFKHAIGLIGDDAKTSDLLIVRNVASLLSKTKQIVALLGITTPIVEADVSREFAKDDKLADLYTMHMHGLIESNERASALVLAEELLSVDGLSPVVSRWVVSTATSMFGLDRSDDEWLGQFLDRISEDEGSERFRDLRVVNNVAFALAELGRIGDADRWIGRGSWAIHKEAYITATLGLIAIKKGDLVRGEKLYREAIGLAVKQSDKIRIRQKLNVELGRALMSKDVRKSKRYLEKAVEERRGEEVLARQAKRLMKELP